MAYGPKYQVDFSYFYWELQGGIKKPKSWGIYLLLFTTTTSTVIVIPIARLVTVSAAEVSRRRSITLPVVRVRVVSPAPLVGAPSRSFGGWLVLTATTRVRLWRLTCAPSTSTLITQGFSFGLLFVGRMLPLLCPGINFTFRFSIAGLRIRDAKLYDALLAKSLAGILPKDLLHSPR